MARQHSLTAVFTRNAVNLLRYTIDFRFPGTCSEFSAVALLKGASSMYSLNNWTIPLSSLVFLP